MRRDKTNLVLGALAWLYLGFAYEIVRWHMPYIPLCPYLLITGERCPLCGSTRFIGSLMNGEMAEATHPVVWTGWILLVGSMALAPLFEKCFPPRPVVPPVKGEMKSGY